MHIAPFENKNLPIVDVENPTVPLNYFNIVKLTKGKSFSYQVPGYETCIVPATGSLDVDIEGVSFAALGNRGAGEFWRWGILVRVSLWTDFAELPGLAILALGI